MDGAAGLGLGGGGGGGGGGDAIGDLLGQGDPGGGGDVGYNVSLHSKGARLAGEGGSDGLELLVHLEDAERRLTGTAEEGVVLAVDLEDDVVAGCPDLGLGGREEDGGAVAVFLGAGQHGLGRGGIEGAVGVGQAVREIAAVSVEGAVCAAGGGRGGKKDTRLNSLFFLLRMIKRKLIAGDRMRDPVLKACMPINFTGRSNTEDTPGVERRAVRYETWRLPTVMDDHPASSGTWFNKKTLATSNSLSCSYSAARTRPRTELFLTNTAGCFN